MVDMLEVDRRTQSCCSDLGSKAGRSALALFAFPCSLAVQLKLRISTVSLLLVESEEAIAADTVDKDSGLLMQLQGMALEVRTSAVDLTVKSYLEALTLEDRARPDDSPYRWSGNWVVILRFGMRRCGRGSL